MELGAELLDLTLERFWHLTVDRKYVDRAGHDKHDDQ
jgi:hypothetical protein